MRASRRVLPLREVIAVTPVWKTKRPTRAIRALGAVYSIDNRSCLGIQKNLRFCPPEAETRAEATRALPLPAGRPRGTRPAARLRSARLVGAVLLGRPHAGPTRHAHLRATSAASAVSGHRRTPRSRGAGGCPRPGLLRSRAAEAAGVTAPASPAPVPENLPARVAPPRATPLRSPRRRKPAQCPRARAVRSAGCRSRRR